MSIESLWRDLEAWLAEHSPETLAGLQSGATEAQIEEAEAQLGVRLPDEVRACYRVHNGQDADAPWLFDGTEFLPLEEIVSQWTVWKELLDCGEFEEFEASAEDGVRDQWWNAAWIPFTYNGAGDHLCIDLDPAPGGTPGQILEMWHDDDSRPRVANSFGEFFGRFCRRVAAGDYCVSEEYGGLVLKEDLA